MQLFNYLLWITWTCLMLLEVASAWKYGVCSSIVTWVAGIGMTVAMANGGLEAFLGVGIAWCVFEPVAVMFDEKENLPTLIVVLSSLGFLLVTAFIYAGVDWTSSQLAAAAIVPL